MGFVAWSTNLGCTCLGNDAEVGFDDDAKSAARLGQSVAEVRFLDHSLHSLCRDVFRRSARPQVVSAN
jgi:hypothetical protein